MTTAAWDIFMKIRNTSFVAMTYVLGLHSQQMQTSLVGVGDRPSPVKAQTPMATLARPPCGPGLLS